MEGSLPTQPLDPQSHSVSSDPEDVNGEDESWGKLLSVTPKTFRTTILKAPHYTFGRGKANDFVLDNLGVSGTHCKIWREVIEGLPPTIWVEDTSTNGSFINRERMEKGKKKMINSGDTIDLLWKGPDNESNISFIFLAVEKEDSGEEGGPEQTYHIGDVLGSGTFATVRLAIHRTTGQKFAVKIIDKKKFVLSNATKRSNALMDEVNILKKLSHPNVIGIEEMFETESTLYLILELVTGGELFDRIVDSGSFSEAVAKAYFLQMLEALKYLHAQGIAHRDLKPENILLSTKDPEDYTIKISDFGLSRVVSSASFMQTMCGTPNYVAPEVLTATRTKLGYSKAVDLWSCGVILFVMLGGYPPFNDDKDSPIATQIKKADYSFPAQWWCGVSEAAKDLIRHLLVVDPEKRYTVEQALASPWIQGKSVAPKEEEEYDEEVESSEEEQPKKAKTKARGATKRKRVKQDVSKGEEDESSEEPPAKKKK